MKNISLRMQYFTKKFVSPSFSSLSIKIFVFLCCFSSGIQAATITVTNTSDSGSGSLRQAILDANAGDNITFATSADGTIVLSTELVVDKNLVFQGNGTDKTVISGNGVTRVFTISANTTVAMSQLKITKGYLEGLGGGIFSDGTLTLTEVTVTESNSYEGGGLYNTGTLNINQSLITNNTSSDRGAGIHNRGTMSLTQSTVSLNKVSAEIINNDITGGSCASNSCLGGGLYNFGTLVISNSNIINNLSYFGGGVYISQGDATITNSLISNNSAGYGGGVFNYSDTGFAVINSTISYNTAFRYGGGINSPGVFKILQSKIVDNTANRNIAGMFVGNSGKIIHSTIANNIIDGGLYGAIGEIGGVSYTDGTISIYNSILANNDGSNCTKDNDYSGTVNAENSLIEGSLECVNGTNLNNLTDDPALDANLIPSFSSSVINHGKNSITNAESLTTDFAGSTRIYGSVVDIGVYEVQNTAPTANTVSFLEQLNVGQTLTASYNYADIENDSQATSLFQWYTATNSSCTADKTPIVNATNLDYVLTSNELGKYICFAVTPKASTGITTGQTVLVSSSNVVTKIAQTITFNPASSVTYGDAPITLSATSNSGLTVTFASTTSSVCTVSGTTLTIVGVGTCTVTADQAGNSTYNAATQVSKNIAVSKKSITAQADNKSKIVNTANPALTISYTGLANGETIDTPPTVSTTATNSSPMGSYPITCDNSSSTDDHYIITSCSNGTLTVTEIPVVVIPISYNLTVKMAGTGKGTLGGTAAGTYNEGTLIKLAATPDADSTFKAWSPESCAKSFYLWADTTCTATFEQKVVTPPPAPVTYDLTTSTNGTGQGTIQGTTAGQYTAGTQIQLTASAENGSEFKGWTPANCTSFAIIANTNCVATFDLIPLVITPTNTPPENYATLADILVTEGDAALTLNLASYFKDAEDVVLNYQAASQDTNVATVQLNAEVLTVNFANVGTSLIQVTASDSQNTQVSVAFLVTVASKPIVPVPNPIETPNCEPVENYQGVCNGRGKTLAITKIHAEGTIANFIIDKSVNNEGFISDVSLLTTGKISGGKLSGTINNLGTIRNIEFVGKQLSGGTLGGFILNSSPVLGRIHDVNFEPCAFVEGGYWGGVLTGNVQHPVYLNNLTLTGDVVLSNAILGNGVRILGNTQKWTNVKLAKEQPKNHYKWNGQISTESTACFAPLSDTFVLRPELQHRGKAVKILSLAIDKNNQHYSFNQTWYMIQPQLVEIKVAEQRALPAALTFSTSLFQSLPADTTALYLGYQLENGEIVYSGQLK